MCKKNKTQNPRPQLSYKVLSLRRKHKLSTVPFCFGNTKKKVPALNSRNEFITFQALHRLIKHQHWQASHWVSFIILWSCRRLAAAEIPQLHRFIVRPWHDYKVIELHAGHTVRVISQGHQSFSCLQVPNLEKIIVHHSMTLIHVSTVVKSLDAKYDLENDQPWWSVLKCLFSDLSSTCKQLHINN